MSHRNETGSQEKLWKLTYEDDDEVELYGVTGRSLDSGQDSGWISSEDNNNSNNNSNNNNNNNNNINNNNNNNNNNNSLENEGKLKHKEPGDLRGNPMKRRNGGGNDGNGGGGSSVKGKVQRIKIYERKKMQRLNNDDDDDEYENQTTVVTTYELPENSSNEQQQRRQSSGDENVGSDVDAHESGENQHDCPGGKLNKVTRLIIRRDSDLELLVNRVNNLDPFRRCCYGRPRVCSWLPGARCFDWLESTGVERWMSRWPRCLKVTFVLGVSLFIMLIYATIVTVGVRAILAD